MESFTEKLIQLRKDSGLSQAKLAKQLGIPQQTVNKYEHEQVVMTIQKLVDFANFYNVSIDWLLGRSNTKDVNNPVSE
jgi:transcriptional regulator with XRE-family HTH domain